MATAKTQAATPTESAEPNGKVDQEISSMRAVYNALKPMSPEARGRVLKWVVGRLDYELGVELAQLEEAKKVGGQGPGPGPVGFQPGSSVVDEDEEKDGDDD